jgi:murein DD-endopeptidase MepM/ murein hydrolase activator NlpD
MLKKIMNKKIIFFVFIIILIAFIAFLIFFISSNKSKKDKDNTKENIIAPEIEKEEEEKNPILIENFSEETNGIIHEPISNAEKRITKKPFGIKIDSENSPVQPEKFSGYHTGVDFETFPEEENLEIDILAICTGPLVAKNQINGYGGTVVQQCEINNEPTTVIYGHLKLKSVSKNVGENLNRGQKIGLLGQGFSLETDGERKHLHLGIHRGKDINFLGYIENSKDLVNWIDYQSLIIK